MHLENVSSECKIIMMSIIIICILDLSTIHMEMHITT